MKREGHSAVSKKSRRARSAAVLTMAALLLAGCGSASGGSHGGGNYAATSDSAAPAAYDSYAEEAYYGDYEDYDYNTGTYDTASGGTEAKSAPDVMDTTRKLIRTVNLDVETKAFDDLMTAIDAQISELNGYVESANIYNGSRYSDSYAVRNGSMTIRIPAQNLSAFMDSIGALCNVTRKTESVDDVTLQYVDMESEKAALQTEYDRLLELLAQAADMEDILTIEDRLTTLRYQMQSMESQLRAYDNKVTYSTIYLEIQEVKELTPIIEEEPTVGERIRAGFTDSVQNIKEGFTNFGVWFVTKLPYLIIWAIVIVIIVFICKALWGEKARMKRQAKRQAKYANVGSQLLRNGAAPAAPAPGPVYTNQPGAPTAPTAPTAPARTENSAEKPQG
ncbi:MAG: DUF4349 domain-containing protein [Lachnospiraceae bacterium]|nr:DUF4349 domain-containing protein [Lachnospiraceae bacterium]